MMIVVWHLASRRYVEQIQPVVEPYRGHLLHSRTDEFIIIIII